MGMYTKVIREGVWVRGDPRIDLEKGSFTYVERKKCLEKNRTTHRKEKK